MAARVKDRVTITVAIARTTEATVAATAATLLARAASPALPPSSWHFFYNPWTGNINMYPRSALRGATGSHRCAWTDHGRPSVHTALGTDLGSTVDVRLPTVAAGHFSFLDALARLVRPAVTSQLLQHNDALDAVRSYRVGHRLRCVDSHHVRSW
jgi:hypothetical protein